MREFLIIISGYAIYFILRLIRFEIAQCYAYFCEMGIIIFIIYNIKISNWENVFAGLMIEVAFIILYIKVFKVDIERKVLFNEIKRYDLFPVFVAGLTNVKREKIEAMRKLLKSIMSVKEKLDKRNFIFLVYNDDQIEVGIIFWNFNDYEIYLQEKGEIYQHTIEKAGKGVVWKSIIKC